ncbi:MAG: protein-glutamate O-methyltransferase CheR [Desulfarculaceae bacterium]|nr:protein-glutamate O-methyltransferase CheR [Desulfarculaceae bacterium]MCF8071503.1 protein-glutamate O-methyltransferase CheR [Desulfarculaceae bacterium]MCF8102318.1 protein-glutamate O-methyltransferase CheR [Desulfarculaceae bacterium]MCF8114782.1 protein-glutamate O-methyltransferase CheR [Desulfarculaceae bacterium]
MEQIEIDLLLEAVYRRYGYDFRSYARASIERRVRQFLSRQGLGSIMELTDQVLHDPKLFSSLARYFSIAVTELFRDPWAYRVLREKVVPVLQTWPHFKVWHAGCSSGEEVYSLAILLREEEVYHRSTIYATDFNDSVLQQAREGIYEIDRLKDATRNYQGAGGKASFSDYYHARYGAAVMDGSLRERIVFSNHNLVTDTVFSEMHLIFCRNVLIYFDRGLQNRVLKLFDESLVNGGFLCLGSKEDIQFTEVADRYEVVDRQARIFKKKARP